MTAISKKAAELKAEQQTAVTDQLMTRVLADFERSGLVAADTKLMQLEPVSGNDGNDQPVEPGKRHTTVTASYRLPKLRNSVVLYADEVTEDEPLALAYPRELALNEGMYLPHLPHIKNFDFRCEGIYTDLPGSGRTDVFCVHAHYAGGYR